MDNVTCGEVVVLSSDDFEVFEMVERKGFLIPAPPPSFALPPKSPAAKAPRCDADDDLVSVIAWGGL